MLDNWKVPSVMLLKVMCKYCVEYGVGVDSVSNASSFGVFAGCVDGVDNGVGESGVAHHRLVAHDPDVHKSSIWVNGVVGIVGVVVEHAFCAAPWGSR